MVPRGTSRAAEVINYWVLPLHQANSFVASGQLTADVESLREPQKRTWNYRKKQRACGDFVPTPSGIQLVVRMD
jgi:hypothetical protein